MLLEHDPHPIKRVSDLEACLACGYQLAAGRKAPRCSECGLRLISEGRVLELERKRSWCGVALLKKLAFVCFGPIFALSIVLMGFSAGRTMAATTPPPQRDTSTLILVLSFFFVFYSLLGYWSIYWLIGFGKRKGVIVGPNQLTMYGFSQQPLDLRAEDVDEMVFRPHWFTTAPLIPRSIRSGPQLRLRLPGILKANGDGRRALTALLLAFALKNQGNPKIVVRPGAFCLAIHSGRRRARARQADDAHIHQMTGGSKSIVLGSPNRRCWSLSILCLIFFSVLTLYLQDPFCEIVLPILPYLRTEWIFAALPIAATIDLLISRCLPYRQYCRATSTQLLLIDDAAGTASPVNWPDVQEIQFGVAMIAPERLRARNGQSYPINHLTNQEALLIDLLRQCLMDDEAASIAPLF